MPRTLEMNFLFPFVSFDDRKNYLKIHAALVKFIVIFFFCFVEWKDFVLFGTPHVTLNSLLYLACSACEEV